MTGSQVVHPTMLAMLRERHTAGDAMNTTSNPNNDLAGYLHWRLGQIERCDAEIETKLADDRVDLGRKIDRDDFLRDDPAVLRIIRHIEFTVGNTFRYTMLVGVCSFLEEALTAIGGRLVPKYESTLKLKSKSGNWLKRHIQVLKQAVNLPVTQIQPDLNAFNSLITLRNCVVHAWGRVAGATNPEAVKMAAASVETAGISGNGYLFLGDQVIPNAITTAEKIADHVLASQLKVSMT